MYSVLMSYARWFFFSALFFASPVVAFAWSVDIAPPIGPNPVRTATFLVQGSDVPDPVGLRLYGIDKDNPGVWLAIASFVPLDDFSVTFDFEEVCFPDICNFNGNLSDFYISAFGPDDSVITGSLDCAAGLTDCPVDSDVYTHLVSLSWYPHAVDVDVLVSSLVSAVGTLLYYGFLLIAPIVAALIGLGILVRYVKRWLLGEMHSHTRLFMKSPGFVQKRWARLDREWSRDYHPF